MVDVGFNTQDEIVAALRAGQVVGIPTDTVYGLAADPLNPRALRQLAQIKGRDSNQPIAVLFSELSKLACYVEQIDQIRRIELFWPGAMTAIVRAKQDGLPAPLVTEQLTIGIRKPASEIALKILEEMGGFLAVTSANKHDEPPANSAQEVIDTFGHEVSVLDGGLSTHGVASTVVDFTANTPRLLRQGALEFQEVMTAWMTD